MKELCRFTLKQKFSNFSTVIINMLIIVIIAVVFNFDRIVFNQGKTVINLDETTDYLFDELEDTDEIKYQLSTEKKDGCILHYDENFKLKCEQGISNDNLETIENEIKEVMEKEYESNADLLTREYIKEYKRIEDITIDYKKDKDSQKTAVLSILYFLLNIAGPLISNEIISDKNENHYEMLVSCIGKKKYFYSKIISGYLGIIFQLLLVVLYVAVNALIRWNYDGFSGLLLFSGLNTTKDIIKIPIVSVMLSVVTVQFILLFFTTQSRSTQESSQKQTLFYLIIMFIYYTVLTDKGSLTEIISNIPLINMMSIPVYIIDLNQKKKNVYLIYQIIELSAVTVLTRISCTKDIK